MRNHVTAEAFVTNLFLTAGGAVALGVTCAVLGCGTPALALAVGGLVTAAALATARPLRTASVSINRR